MILLILDYQENLGSSIIRWPFLFRAELGYTIGNFFIKAYTEILWNVVQPPDIYGQRIFTPLPGGGGVTPDVLIGDQHLTKIIPSITYKINQTLGDPGRND